MARYLGVFGRDVKPIIAQQQNEWDRLFTLITGPVPVIHLTTIDHRHKAGDEESVFQLSGQ